jgi:hypothetical protein
MYFLVGYDFFFKNPGGGMHIPILVPPAASAPWVQAAQRAHAAPLLERVTVRPHPFLQFMIFLVLALKQSILTDFHGFPQFLQQNSRIIF